MALRSTVTAESWGVKLESRSPQFAAIGHPYRDGKTIGAHPCPSGQVKIRFTDWCYLSRTPFDRRKSPPDLWAQLPSPFR